MKIKLKCELPNCNSQFAVSFWFYLQVLLLIINKCLNLKFQRKETYKNHVISHHKDMGDENLRSLLDKIKHFQLPKIDLNNISLQ